MFSIFQPTRNEVSMLNKNNSGSVNNWAYVVMAILAVNKFTLEDVFALSKKLEANGLFDLHNLASIDKNFLFVGRSILSRHLYVKKILATRCGVRR
jgi:hypothetical protein